METHEEIANGRWDEPNAHEQTRASQLVGPVGQPSAMHEPRANSRRARGKANKTQGSRGEGEAECIKGVD